MIGQAERIKESKNSYFVSYAVGVNTNPGDETALVVPNKKSCVGQSYFILNGNWIEDYRQCKSKEEQVQLFRDNYEKHAGFWTNSLEDLDEVLNR